ncbi:MAG: transporter substrate-binding domain-containing protein, partial [Anaerolineales bacterium]|nr:transporter substrate-binding domain-containing protein [Anaerolineales bacterium]
MDEGGETAVTAVPPTPTPAAAPTAASSSPDRDQDFVVIATDAPNEPYTSFNAFGEVTGLMPDMMARIAEAADLDYELVVTPFEGALSSINRDFDAVLSTLTVTDTAGLNIAYTTPYFEIGQVLVVLADESTVQSAADLPADTAVGVRQYSFGAAAAESLLPAVDVVPFDSYRAAVEALVQMQLGGVIMDHYSAAAFVSTYPEQLKIAGGTGQTAWISRNALAIAVAAADEALLARLNEAIAQVTADASALSTSAAAWLVPEVAGIDVGESRVGTPAGELVIGVVGNLQDMDPAGPPDLISWEVKQNTMGGLYRFSAANELQPLLAADFPIVSADGLTYTITLRQGLRFPDGSELTAEDVKWSIDRAAVAGSGSYLVNEFLKDADEDNFADGDAVQVIDTYTVQIALQEPAGYFVNVLATPPYFPISSDCYRELFDPLSTCGGIGPYVITGWEVGNRIALQANPDWPGEAPAFANVQVRFFGTAVDMQRALADFQSIDLAWTGLPYADFLALADTDVTGDGRADVIGWQGPGAFKSYLIFEQSAPPWDSENVRRAAAYAIDREALANEVFNGQRLPLRSPVPDAVPGHVPTLPTRDLDQARALLQAEGYSAAEPLAITLWYLNDGRYTPLEEAYAQAIAAQLEETGIFDVTLSGAPWEVFQAQIFSCAYPAYLLGWPSPGAPVNYLDVTSWTNFFVQNTDRVFCSNYESEEMARLVTAVA